MTYADQTDEARSYMYNFIQSLVALEQAKRRAIDVEEILGARKESARMIGIFAVRTHEQSVSLASSLGTLVEMNSSTSLDDICTGLFGTGWFDKMLKHNRGGE